MTICLTAIDEKEKTMTYLDKISSPEDVKKLNTFQLNELSEEIRAFLIDNVMRNGGHLASNLGVVELTLALMKTFDFPKDKLIFDVGHQCYVYKLLTGRKDKFSTLRRFGGISGFPKTSESIYDCFDVGHASTSISAAVGMARARDIAGTDENIVALIGDGALTGGLSFEALNDVGLRKTKMIIVLNDNEMSIQKNVGGLSAHLSKLRVNSRYINTKTGIKEFILRFGTAGKIAETILKKAKNRLKYATIAAPLFENLGLTYIGIIDGNNITELRSALNQAKNVDGPVLIHTFTKKGLGYKAAEENPSKYHGINSSTVRISKDEFKYDDAFSVIMNSLAENNKNLVAITAAMTSGCGLSEFSKRYPDRFFDVGIAEEHAVTMAAGMSTKGIVPVFSVYSTFLQRSYDQIVHDVCLQNLHVVFAVGHAGVTGEDGETHQGLLDLTMLSHIPNMTVLAPSCYNEFKDMLLYAVNECKTPVAVRYPKSGVTFRECETFVPGKGEKIANGKDVMILSCGRMTDTAIKAALLLEKHGIFSSIVNVRSVNPFDRELVEKTAEDKKLVVSLEDNIISGGMGEHIFSKCNINAKKIVLGFDTCFVKQGKQSELIKLHRLEANSVCDRILKELNINA